MKLFSELITLALAVGASATPAKKDWSKVKGPVDGLLLPLDIPGPQSQYEIGKKSGKFAKVDGRLIVLNGRKQYFSGTNAWWMAHLSKNADVDTSFSQIVKTGYKVLRVWGFGEVNTPPPVTNQDPNKVYFRLLNSTGSYVNYGKHGIDRLDYVVHRAERLSVPLILPFINNWGDYGGIGNAYANAFGNNGTNFYTHPQAQKEYKAWIKFVVNRYKKSDGIFAWELGNEPRCDHCSPAVITKWAKEISEYIKSLDPKHLVTLGDEGWFSPVSQLPKGADDSIAYGGKDGVDWVGNMKINTLDFATVHTWPHAWSYNYSWANKWIQQHDELARKANKPWIMEEYGVPLIGNHTTEVKPWQDTLYKSGVAADFYWQFGTRNVSFPWQNLPDENAIFYGDEEYKLLGFYQAWRMALKPVWPWSKN